MDPKRPFSIIHGSAHPDSMPEAERLRNEIEARNRQEVAIAELGQAALTGVDPSILLGQACALVELTLGAAGCRVLEFVERGRMVSRASIGDATWSTCSEECDEDDSIGMFVFLEDGPVSFSVSENDTRFKCGHVREVHHVRTCAGVTIRTQHGPYGVILTYSRSEHGFRDYELAFLKSVANILGEAIARGRTEVALRRSEMRLRHLIAAALDAVVTFGRDGIVLEWNPQAERIFETGARDVVGKPLPLHLIARAEARMLRRYLNRKGGRGSGLLTGRRIETTVRTRSGEPFPVEVTVESVGLGEDQLFTAFIRDISERVRAQQELERRERRFRTIVEKSWSGVALLDPSLCFSFVGSSTLNILGYDETDLLRRNIFDYIHPRERDLAQQIFTDLAVAATLEAHGELRFRHKNGTWVWVEGFAQNMLNEPSVNGIVLNYRDITQRRLTEKQLEYRAHYDALTGLPNRVLFRDRVINALAQAYRRAGGVAIMYLDLDHFKLINDGLGHSVGDALLASVAQRLSRSLRLSDTISRIGGDEFAVLIPDVVDSNAAAGVARKLLEALEEPFFIDDQRLYATSSIGISVYPNDGVEYDTLVKCADAAMYRAKELGRNQARLFTPSMNEKYVRRLATEQKLHLALDRGELELYYQPIYDPLQRSIASVEALIRWNAPDRGVVGPGEFIPFAEETGLIVPMGDWVLRRACDQIAAWRAASFRTPRVSVNISAQHLQHPEFMRKLRRVLDDTGVDPHLLQIEITETAALLEPERMIRLLREVRELGPSIAIDDFGTGQSSLIYLRQYPIDTIKIDKAFLRDVAADETAGALVSYTINLAHTLHMTVVAEGVETEDQYSFLRRHGCDLMQGYLFAYPLRAPEIEQYFVNYVRPKTLEIPVPPLE